MTTKHVTGLIGSIMLIIGAFAPVVRVPFFGQINYFNNGTGDGAIILVLGAISLILVVLNKYTPLAFTGIGSLLVASYTYINFSSKIEQGQAALSKNLAGNPFRGIAEGIAGAAQIEWAIPMVVIGSILLVAASYKPSTPSKRLKRRLLSMKKLICLTLCLLVLCTAPAWAEINKTVDDQTGMLVMEGRSTLSIPEKSNQIFVALSRFCTFNSRMSLTGYSCSIYIQNWINDKVKNDADISFSRTTTPYFIAPGNITKRLKTGYTTKESLQLTASDNEFTELLISKSLTLVLTSKKGDTYKVEIPKETIDEWRTIMSADLKAEYKKGI